MNEESVIIQLDQLLNTLSKKNIFSSRTISLMNFDILRLKTRLKHGNDHDIIPSHTKLHLGSGSRQIQGWLNVDIINSDYDVDLACGRLPWKSASFDCIVSQHFVEHLDLLTECIPLLNEIRRTLKRDGEIWISCPDIEKICRSYLKDHMLELLADTKSRWPDFSLGDIPTSHMINHLFHQNGEHKNLYDFKILDWILRISGFKDIRRLSETDLLQRFPEFQPRRDDFQSIYVSALAN